MCRCRAPPGLGQGHGLREGVVGRGASAAKEADVGVVGGEDFRGVAQIGVFDGQLGADEGVTAEHPGVVAVADEATVGQVLGDGASAAVAGEAAAGAAGDGVHRGGLEPGAGGGEVGFVAVLVPLGECVAEVFFRDAGERGDQTAARGVQVRLDAGVCGVWPGAVLSERAFDLDRLPFIS